MSTSKTDSSLSIGADEFVWNTADFTPVHRLLLPYYEKWLADKKGWSILDLGCGNGVFTHAISKFVNEAVGVDMSVSGIEIAKKSFPNVPFDVIPVSGELPDHLRNRFDAVSATEVIEHLLLPRELFQRAKEALKPGGELILSTPYHGYLKNLALALVNKFDSHWHPCRDYGHVKFFSVATLTQLFEEQGFKVLDVKRIGRVPSFACSMIVRGRLI